MIRRNFLKMVTGMVASGQQVAKTASAMTTADINLKMLGLAGAAAQRDAGPSPASDPEYAKTWAAKRLAQLAMPGKRQRKMRKDRFWVDSLDPDVASLRSVSLGSKVRMSRDRQFERSERAERVYLKGIIAGLWE